MGEAFFFIRTPTLSAITKAIALVGDNGGLPTIEIPNGAEYNLCFIYKRTLVAIADYIRAKEGTTADIPVTELASRLEALVGNNDDSGDSTTAVLGRAVLGRAVLGKSVSTLPKLEQPSISIVVNNGKLQAPSIQLDVSDNGDDNDGDNTSTTAILGRAVLGRAVLGRSGGDLPKLQAPSISLVASNGKLQAPSIRLDGGAPKLTAPTIQIETVQQLATPTIRIENAVLAAPHIYLE